MPKLETVSAELLRIVEDLPACRQTELLDFALFLKEKDEQSINLGEYDYGNFILRFRTPIQLFPTKDESGRLLRLEYPDLGIHVFAETREQLLEELWEQILFLWEDYALCCDDEMTLQSQILKKNLLKAIERVFNNA